jgi:hypothetical protein
MVQAMACCLPCSIPTHWLISLVGQRCWRMQITRLSRRRYSSRLTLCLLFIFTPTPRSSRAVLASTPTYPAPPIPATSLTGRAGAASRSSCGYQHDPSLGTPCRRVGPTSASPGHQPESRIHPFLPVRLVAGHLASNLAHWGALGAGGQLPAHAFEIAAEEAVIHGIAGRRKARVSRGGLLSGDGYPELGVYFLRCFLMALPEVPTAFTALFSCTSVHSKVLIHSFIS